MTDREREIPRRKVFEIVAGLGIVAVVAGCSANLPNKPETSASPSTSPEHEKNHEIDLVQTGTWEYMPGVKKEDGSLHISNTGLALRTLEETWVEPTLPEYIATPPQNTYGTHIEVSQPSGDIGFTARLSDIKGKATLSFQSLPTYHYDERIYRHQGVDIEVDDTNLILSYWQNGQVSPTLKKVLPFDAPSSTAEFTLTQTNRGITIIMGGQSETIPTAKIFTSNEVWFGMNASDSWKLDSFNTYPIGNNEVKSINVSRVDFGKLSPAGLQAFVAKKRPDLVVGTAIDLPSLLSDPYMKLPDGKYTALSKNNYAKLVVENFGGLSTEMLAKPQALQPEQGHFVWNEFDALVDFAKRHNKQVHLHTLLFSEANPKWLEEGLKNASAPEALALMKQVIQPTVSRHKDEIKTIDVVNEPFDPDNWAELRQNLWTKPLGPAYMDNGFKIAHGTAPNALLGINEWGLETDDDRWNAMIELVKGMKARKVPIHYIGFQMHFDEETLADEEVMYAILNGGQIERRFKELEELGLKVRVSEISVAGANKNLQARVYAAVLKACKNAPNCIGFNMWGAASNAAYFTSEPDGAGQLGPEQFGDDAPWQQNKDGTYSEKPAVAAMKAVN